MILDFIFGWNRKIRKLRKKWDRLREKAIRKKGPLRLEVLGKLDSIEGQLRMLEERQMTRVERARFYREVAIGLAEIKVLVKMKSENYQPSGRNVKVR